MNQSEPVKKKDGLNKAAGARKCYSPPRLIDYGSIAKLTQSGNSVIFDGMSNSMACL
mgnify:CR=1